MDIMKFTGFTPGPWRTGAQSARECTGEWGIWAGECLIAQTKAFGTSIEEESSNSELLSAAPQLLELARLGLELAERITRFPAKHDSPFVRGLRIKARELKAKAQEAK